MSQDVWIPLRHAHMFPGNCCLLSQKSGKLTEFSVRVVMHVTFIILEPVSIETRIHHVLSSNAQTTRVSPQSSFCRTCNKRSSGFHRDLMLK